MAIHRIQLKGPWDYHWQESHSVGVDPISRRGTVTMPQDWKTIFGDSPGAAQFRRKFHRPTNLEPHERVMLVFTEIRGRGTAWLNQDPLGEFIATGDSIEFEISSMMKPFNEIIVQIDFNPQTEPTLKGGLYGAAALEIRTGNEHPSSVGDRV